MKLDLFQTFLCVSKLKSISKAALELKLTQPAVTLRITALEKEFGVQLFERKTNGLFLTREGALFQTHAEKIHEQIKHLREEITPSKEVKGIIRIGVAETIVHSWLPILLTQISLKYPKLIIELSVDISKNLKSQLLNKELDLSILMGPISELNIQNILLPTFELGWFSDNRSNDYNLIKTPIISFPRASSPYQELLSNLMKRYGDTGRIFPSTTLSTSIEMIASGIGIGILPLVLAEPIVQQGKIKPFDPGWNLSDLQFTASYSNTDQSKILASIADIALQVAKDFKNPSSQDS